MPETRSRYHHIPVIPKQRCAKGSFRVIELGKGIKATVCCPRGKYSKKQKVCKVGTIIQKVMFPREQYSFKEAKAWVKKHPYLKRKGR